MAYKMIFIYWRQKVTEDTNASHGVDLKKLHAIY